MKKKSKKWIKKIEDDFLVKCKKMDDFQWKNIQTQTTKWDKFINREKKKQLYKK